MSFWCATGLLSKSMRKSELTLHLVSGLLLSSFTSQIIKWNFVVRCQVLKTWKKCRDIAFQHTLFLCAAEQNSRQNRQNRLRKWTLLLITVVVVRMPILPTINKDTSGQQGDVCVVKIDVSLSSRTVKKDYSLRVTFSGSCHWQIESSHDESQNHCRRWDLSLRRWLRSLSWKH